MKFKNPYFNTKEKIELLSKWIIIQSVIYYEYNKNLVTDAEYDLNSKALLELIKSYPKTFKKSKYYNILYDFEGSGYMIFSRLTPTQKDEYIALINNILYFRRG